MPLHSLNLPPYGNCKILNKYGVLICRCGKKKAYWYLNRNLATRIADEPLTIQLTFETNGPGHIGENKFYLEDKENICVVCGTEKELTLHHIVPYCYRKFFPERLKRKGAWYDIVAMCIPCHAKYEKSAWELKEKIAQEFDIPVGGRGLRTNQEVRKVYGAALALVRHGDKMPESRKKELLDTLRKFYGKEITNEEINAATRLQKTIKDDYVTHGEVVVKNLVDLEQFVFRWRNHFIGSMKPKFLPESWKIDETIYRR